MLWVLDEKTTKAAKQVYGSKQTRKPDKRKSPPGRRLPRSIRAQSYQKVVVMSPLRASSLVSVCLHGLPARKKNNSYILFSLAAQSVCTQSARLLILRLSTGSALAWGCACFFFFSFSFPSCDLSSPPCAITRHLPMGVSRGGEIVEVKRQKPTDRKVTSGQARRRGPGYIVDPSVQDSRRVSLRFA